MGLNIKNPATEQAIRDLAARTGESLTDAIANAVREKLAKIEEETARQMPARTLEEYLALIKPLQDEIAEYRHRTGDTRSAIQVMKDFDEEFYDEDGIPK